MHWDTIFYIYILAFNSCFKILLKYISELVKKPTNIFEVGRLDTYFKVGRLEYIYQRLIKLELCVISWHLPAVYTGLVI